MEILPILSALRRNKTGALLIGIQIALTIAIVCNTLSIIEQRLQRMHRPSGIDEPDILTFSILWPAGHPENRAANIQEDLEALRSLPGVVDAVQSNCPLSGWGSNTVITRTLGQKGSGSFASEYHVDEHGLTAFGIRLISGRWFMREEILDLGVANSDLYPPPVAIVTMALAKAIFPNEPALGKTLYVAGRPTHIIGIVDRLQSISVASTWSEAFVENSILMPMRLLIENSTFVVRTKPGQLSTVLREIPKRLAQVNRNRVTRDVLPFAEVRARAYGFYQAVNWILGAVCGLLLIVTALGIVGLTTYWVARRRRQIGIRRALGATRLDILRYFHTENLLIVAIGGLAGISLGLAGNLWLAEHLQLTRMEPELVWLGSLIVLVLSQAAVIWPAWRAASTSPAIAIGSG